jgi:hypothetical protein
MSDYKLFQGTFCCMILVVLLLSNYVILTPTHLQTYSFTPLSYGAKSYWRQSLCGYADVADNPDRSLPSATVQLRLLACNCLRARSCVTIHTVSFTLKAGFLDRRLVTPMDNSFEFISDLSVCLTIRNLATQRIEYYRI